MSTSETEHPTIETLFGNLDRWRHFAGYPLEARVDALVGLFLPGVIEDCCEVKGMHSQIIPQFPLKKPNNNQSDKVDFFALSNDGGRAFLVEVKTDMDSREPRQYEYMKDAKDKGMRDIICDLKEVAKAKNVKRARKKYFHILHALDKIGLIELPPGLEDKMYQEISRGVYDLIDEIKLLKVPNLEVICIQPREDKSVARCYSDFRFIYFDELADSIQKHGELGELLACYLRRWKSDPGLCRPAKV